MQSRWTIGLATATCLPAVAEAQHLYFAQGGTNATESFGASIARIHDFDHDGRDDLAVGAPGFDAGPLANAGRVVVISGTTGAVLASTPGGSALEKLGTAILGVSDLNGDGIPEIAAGAPGFGGSNPPGAIRILDGVTLGPLGILVGPGPGARIGEHLARLADLTGDGKPEVATGARGLSSGTLVSPGAALICNLQVGVVIKTFFGLSAFETYGASVAAIPDMTGDGRPELVVGAPGADPLGINGAGRIDVIEPVSGALLLSIPGIAANDGLGATCAGIADQDGDLVPDVLGGAPGAAPGGLGLAGSAFVFAGAGGQMLARFDGQTAGDQLGLVLAALDDVDFDGVRDFAAGSPLWSEPGNSSAGRVTVYSGGSFSLLYRYDGTATGDEFGGSIAALGDMNSDARQDFAIGWTAYDGGAVDGGSARVHLGQFPNLSIATTGQFGTSAELRCQAKPLHGLFLLIDVAPGTLPTPFGIACIAFTPAWQVLFMGPTSAEGWLLWPTTIPATGLAAGTTFTMQAAVFEPFSFGGAWLGNCVSVTVTPDGRLIMPLISTGWTRAAS